MTYQLLQGDCAQVLKKFEAESIDLTVTSPPYDNLRTYDGYTFDFPTIAQQLYRVTKPGGVVVWVVGDATIDGSETGTSFRQALYFKECGFNLHDTMIYQKPGGGAVGSNNCYWQSFEYMFVFSKGSPAVVNKLHDKKNKKAGSISTSGTKSKLTGVRLHPVNGTIVGDYGYRDNIWTILPGNNGDDQTEHPAPFPEALARDHILSWSNPGDLVLDPMAGSGTVAKMAIELGRRSVNIEISEKYCALIRKRLSGARIPLPFEVQS